MSKITLLRLEETDAEKYPSHTLTDYYDVIHKMMEAIALLDGTKIKGEGAHQELVDYVCTRDVLGESVRTFMQEMREYRNRISYEGFMVRAEYIKSNKEKIELIIRRLAAIYDVKKAG